MYYLFDIQEEVISLPVVTSAALPDTDSPVEDDIVPVDPAEAHLMEERQRDIVQLRPPEALFRPIEYPPLHIFVSYNFV